MLGTGNSTLTGTDGKAIARNPGQTRWEILIDNNGTPQDPTDDEFLADLGNVEGVHRPHRRLLRSHRRGAHLGGQPARCPATRVV